MHSYTVPISDLRMSMKPRRRGEVDNTASRRKWIRGWYVIAFRYNLLLRGRSSGSIRSY